MEENTKRKPGSLLKRALFNQYNYIMMGAAGLFSVTTGSWLPALVGAGAEVLWLVLGADTRAFRHWVARQETKEARDRMGNEVSAMLRELDESYVERFDALVEMGREIQTLAADNKGLETALIQDEMAKLEQLVYAFVKMATAHQRIGRYIADEPAARIEREIAQAQRALRQEQDERVQVSLKQSLSLAQKRLAKHQQIEGGWKALGVQMDTLEKSFDYLKSHILGIGTKEELAAALDDLVNGVASVSELDASTAELTDELRGAAASRLAGMEKS